MHEDVFVLMMEPPDARVTRQLIMSSKLGKDTEPVDEIKGQVCFTSIDNTES